MEFVKKNQGIEPPGHRQLMGEVCLSATGSAGLFYVKTVCRMLDLSIPVGLNRLRAAAQHRIKLHQIGEPGQTDDDDHLLRRIERTLRIQYGQVVVNALDVSGL